MAVTEPAEARSGRSSVLVLSLLVVAAVAVYGFDQLTKNWVVENLIEGRSVPVLGEALQWTFVRNSGAAFSLASGTTWVFSIIATGVTGVIIWFAGKIRSLAWGLLFGMLLGGTVGNLTDRLFREPGFGIGHVIDFIHVWGFPAIFNVADIFIVSSMGLFILLTILGIGLDGRRLPPRGARPEPSVSVSDTVKPADEA